MGLSSSVSARSRHRGCPRSPRQAPPASVRPRRAGARRARERDGKFRVLVVSDAAPPPRRFTTRWSPTRPAGRWRSSSSPRRSLRGCRTGRATTPPERGASQPGCDSVGARRRRRRRPRRCRLRPIQAADDALRSFRPTRSSSPRTEGAANWKEREVVEIGAQPLPAARLPRRRRRRAGCEELGNRSRHASPALGATSWLRQRGDRCLRSSRARARSPSSRRWRC